MFVHRRTGEKSLERCARHSGSDIIRTQSICVRKRWVKVISRLDSL
ncbi:hypothetical protein Pd630_LPD16080 (plasmid) [Rhodococcus opacus PD630]|nr:hypothetical protein Pd630_LPD16080 [Rhodococcus opacus PD630]